MATIRRGRIVEGSCWTCRKKRVKCDLTRPTCTRCQNSEQRCDYGPVAPIKWVGGSALRGRNAPAHPPEILEAMPSRENSNHVLMAPPATAPLDKESLLLYFSNAVLPRFQLMEEVIPLDLNVVMQDQPLLEAMVAVSQAHYDLVSHVTSNTTVLCRRQARHTAIQSLRQRLESGVDSTETAQQLFTINVLFCMLDGMIEPSEPLNASMCHLKGGASILNRWSNTPASILMTNGLAAHLLSVFATMDLVHALLSGDKPYFDPLIWHMFSDIQAWFGRLPRDDRFLVLLKCYSEMASLGHLVVSYLHSENAINLVEKCLPSIETTLESRPPKPISDTDVPMSPDHWYTFCALYELSGMIYLHRALRQRPVDDPTVQAITRKGVEMLLDEALPGMMAHCVILPVFIIGSHCIHSQDRRAIMQALSPSISYLSFGNLQLMNDLLKEIWSKQNMEEKWWESFREISEKVFIF